MTDREIMQMALEALKEIHPGNMTPMAEEAWNKAITTLSTRLAEPDPLPPPPECQTEGEKLAYAFGWWKALETKRMNDD